MRTEKYLVQVWDVSNGRLLFSSDGNGMAWSFDGALIAIWETSQSRVQIWDATIKKNIYTYTGHRQPITSVAWSPNGRRLASSSLDSTIQVWNAINGSYMYTYGGHVNGVSNVFYSHDGTYIGSVDDNSIQVWAAG